jgi:regulator of nonsense transcripts 2
MQDMFAELRPNMTRHSSLEELNDAHAKLEENKCVVSAEKGGNERHTDRKSRPKQYQNAAADANSSRPVNRPDKNGLDHEEAERESSSDSASTYQDGHEHEEERSDAMSGNEDHSEGIGMPIDFDEEECVKVRHRVVQVDPRRL